MPRRATGLMGTCGACGGRYRVVRGSQGTIVAKHGFRRPYGHGYHVGSCSGASTLPHELWPLTAVETLDSLRQMQERAESRLHQLQAGHYPTVIVRALIGARRLESRVGDPNRVREERLMLADAENHLRWVKTEVKRVESRVSDWQQEDLVAV